MNLTPRQFWFLVNQINRLRAEDDLRRLQVMGAVNTSEAYEQAVENLQKTVGEIYIWEPSHLTDELVLDPDTGLDPEFDREGLRQLKAQMEAGLI